MDNFIYLVYSLRWQDLVDIGLVSYILLRFYVLFRGTNAFRVLIGMTLLWFFQQLAVSQGSSPSCAATGRSPRWYA